MDQLEAVHQLVRGLEEGNPKSEALTTHLTINVVSF